MIFSGTLEKVLIYTHPVFRIQISLRSFHYRYKYNVTFRRISQ